MSGSAARKTDASYRDDLGIIVGGASILARVGVRIFSRVTVEGTFDRLPRAGPLIIAVNHVSNADGAVVAGWFQSRLGRRIHWLGKREMVEWPILGWFVRQLSVHPIDRGAGDLDAFRTALRVLEEGHVLLTFPEGTRSANGVLGEGKEGLASLALRTNAPIVPIGLAGTRRLWPKGGKPRFGAHVTMRVGEPFTLAEALPAGLDRRTAKGAATELVMRRIAALLPADQRGRHGADTDTDS
jgi:1-acyl-sn-glycerol-3-phosphate acyltransferase